MKCQASCLLFKYNVTCPDSADAGGEGSVKMIISLEPNVGFTSNQTVNLNLSVVYRDVSKEMSIWTMEGPWRALFHQLSPKISLAGSI